MDSRCRICNQSEYNIGNEGNESKELMHAVGAAMRAVGSNIVDQAFVEAVVHGQASQPQSFAGHACWGHCIWTDDLVLVDLNHILAQTGSIQNTELLVWNWVCPGIDLEVSLCAIQASFSICYVSSAVAIVVFDFVRNAVQPGFAGYDL